MEKVDKRYGPHRRLPIPEGYKEIEFYSLDSHRQWSIRNPELTKEINKEYRNRPESKILKAQNKKKHALKDVNKFVYHRWTQYLKSQYNITDTQYWALYDSQSGVCAMCGKPETVIRKLKVYGIGVETCRLCVDHDHSCCSGPKSCGKCIRGLLCHHCNTTLGSARDSEKTLEQGINYLRKSKRKVV